MCVRVSVRACVCVCVWTYISGVSPCGQIRNKSIYLTISYRTKAVDLVLVIPRTKVLSLPVDVVLSGVTCLSDMVCLASIHVHYTV